jgi:hypothetical protein
MITVSDLIRYLQRQDPDAPVALMDDGEIDGIVLEYAMHELDPPRPADDDEWRAYGPWARL